MTPRALLAEPRRRASKTEASREEGEVRRRNYRELLTVLSETNPRVNKDQLLSSGIRVRMRRKSRWHAHDVQVKVVGALRETGYQGETKDWLVRSHSGLRARHRPQPRRSGSMPLVARRMLQDPSNHAKLHDPDGRLGS